MVILTVFALYLFIGTEPPSPAAAEELCAARASVPVRRGSWPASEAALESLFSAAQEPLLLQKGEAGSSPPPLPTALRQRLSWAAVGEALGVVHAQADLASAPGIFPFHHRNALLSGVSPEADAVFAARPVNEIAGVELVRRLAQQRGAGRPRYFSSLILKTSALEAGRATPAIGLALLRESGVRQLAAAAKASSRSQLQANIWLGSTGSITPLHLDASDNVFVQLQGSKRVWLLPPAASLHLTLEPLHSAGHRQLAEAAGPTGSRTRSLSTVEGRSRVLRGGSHQWRVAELGPGDALLVPAYWLHHVETVSAPEENAEENAEEEKVGAGRSLSLSFWAGSLSHAALLRLQKLDVPHDDAWELARASGAIAAGSRLGAAGVYLRKLAVAAGISPQRTGRLLRRRYASYAAAAATAVGGLERMLGNGWERDCEPGGMDAVALLLWGSIARRDSELAPFVAKGAPLLRLWPPTTNGTRSSTRSRSKQEDIGGEGNGTADGEMANGEAVQLLNLVYYAERLLPWTMGLRGDTAHKAPLALRRQLPALAMCLGGMLGGVEAEVEVG
jgi:hypothetical protein